MAQLQDVLLNAAGLTLSRRSSNRLSGALNILASCTVGTGNPLLSCQTPPAFVSMTTPDHDLALGSVQSALFGSSQNCARLFSITARPTGEESPGFSSRSHSERRLHMSEVKNVKRVTGIRLHMERN